MDLSRLLIFAAVFAAFLIVARLLSSSGESYSVHAGIGSTPGEDPSKNPNPTKQVLTGAEIPFPAQVPQIESVGDGKYNRPILRNYYFRKTDLVTGPEDPSMFCDDLTLELEHPNTGYGWTMEYSVATPQGIQRYLESENYSSLLLSKLLIVKRWNLAEIMKDVMDDVIADQQIANSDLDEHRGATRDS